MVRKRTGKRVGKMNGRILIGYIFSQDYISAPGKWEDMEDWESEEWEMSAGAPGSIMSLPPILITAALTAYLQY